MIKSVGLGVAMKNGFDIVKDVADVVTLTNDEDGVAELVKNIWINLCLRFLSSRMRMMLL